MGRFVQPKGTSTSSKKSLLGGLMSSGLVPIAFNIVEKLLSVNWLPNNFFFLNGKLTLFFPYFVLVFGLVTAYLFGQAFQYLGIRKDEVDDKRKGLVKRDEQTGVVSSPMFYDYLFLDKPPVYVRVIRSIGLFLKSLSIILFFAFVIYLAAFFVGCYVIESNGLPVLAKYPDYSFTKLWRSNLYLMVLGGLSGLILAVFLYLYFEKAIGRLSQKVNTEILKKLKESDYRKGTKKDIRDISYSNFEPYEHYLYWGEAKKQNSIFLGLEQDRTPVFVSRDDWKVNTLQIMGNMGTGKSVQAINCLSQCMVNFDDSVIVFDPKDDEFAASVLKKYAKNFYYFDLRRGMPAQLNLFKGVKADELNELFSSTFGLVETDDPSDYYRSNERFVIQELSKKLDGELNAKVILDKAQGLNSELKKKGESILLRLNEVLGLSAIQTNDGVNFAEIIESGACIYVVGSTEDPAVEKLMKMLFIRFCQIVKGRNRMGVTKHVNFFLDEFKYMICRTSVNALGTIRDKNAHIILAHQTLGDLERVSMGVDANEVKTIVKNAPMKWIYKITDIESAEWVSSLTGKAIVENERQHTSPELGGYEIVSTSKEVHTDTDYLIETNVIQTLPKFCAVLVGVDLAKLVYSSPLTITKSEIKVAEKTPFIYEQKASAEYDPLKF